ncbi:MAG: proline racemase family protein [Phycisphaeraceae bacterium]|nr:proline racemase family protein [Phycisphaerae bacterium]MBX3391394.1 proline racemase family protein [Phycisphaeraceae bacterium]
MQRIEVIDSHTEGEPTRIIVSGGPDLGPGTIAERLVVFRERYDHLRSAVINEPRGCSHLVGALACAPTNPRAAAGVIFFNNVGFLNGCGHGTIGLAVTLAHLGRLARGSHVIETPVGEVGIALGDRGRVTITNVPSYRHARSVEVEVGWNGSSRVVRGDVAWGGNWFYLVDRDGPGGHGLDVAMGNLAALMSFGGLVREALDRAGIRGAGGGMIDHVELFGPASRGDCVSKNFVLCPGMEYDRSPCGTGTSAKIACLAADGKLSPGECWGQESIIGTAFFGSFAAMPGESAVRPSITGRAWVTSEATLVIDPADPVGHGIGYTSGAGR